MSKVTIDITMSVDGFVAGPNASLEDPLGQGGMSLHEWAFAAESWREQHGLEGGEHNADSELLEEAVGRGGAQIMGRRMFSGGFGPGPWADDPNAGGWWGDEPPFHMPVFVLTHHAREPLVLGDTTITFVTDGIESALEQARAAAGDKNVGIGGGGSAVQQYLAAGLVDELQVHVAPMFLGTGVRLFDNLGEHRPKLELLRVVESPAVTHIRYRVSS
jgi:dihydrofolate reductase